MATRVNHSVFTRVNPFPTQLPSGAGMDGTDAKDLGRLPLPAVCSVYVTWALMMEAIFVNTVLTVVLSAGMQATAATATNPAANAYSTRSCPLVSFQTRSCNANFLILVILIPVIDEFLS